MLRELVTRPISAVVALIELPVTMQRSLKQANDLMEASRRQLEAMQRQTQDALEQAERMNDLLGRVVRLTEPLEIAQRGGEYVGGRLKRALFGEEQIERAVDDAEAAADHAERAASEAESAAEHAEDEAEVAAEEAESAAEHGEEDGGWQPAASRKKPESGVEVPDSSTIRVIPNQPPPGEPQQDR